MTDSSNTKAVQIAPSLLSADFMNMQQVVRLIEHGDPDWLHVDVMDGHFVPNLTIGPPVIKALKSITAIPLDVHLMIANPAQQLDWYLDAGADLVTVHLEFTGQNKATTFSPGTSAFIDEVVYPERLLEIVERVRAAGRQVGVSINPDTPAQLVLPFLESLDLVLVMSVHPGFGGQGFISKALEKLRLIRTTATAKELDLLIEVDGGIDTQTAGAAAAAGANLLVAGNAIFGQADPLAALASIRQVANAAVQSHADFTAPQAIDAGATRVDAEGGSKLAETSSLSMLDLGTPATTTPTTDLP